MLRCSSSAASASACAAFLALFVVVGCGNDLDVKGDDDVGEDAVPVDDVGEDAVPVDDVGEDAVPDDDVGEDAVPVDDVGEDAAPVDDEAGEGEGDAADVVEEEEEEEEEAVVVAAANDDDDDRSFRVRFATYNVRTSNLNNSAWGDTHVGFDGNDAARMRRVADTIAAQELTVVALQEVRRPEREAVAARLLATQGQRWGTTTQTGGADDTVVVFDRAVWRKVRETRFLVPLQAGLNDRNQIGVLLEHKASGERVWFYSVHFAAAGNAGEAARRTAARRAVASLQAHAVDNGEPFVLGGDFNTDAGSAVGDIFRDAGFAADARNAAATRVGNGCASFNRRAGAAGLQTCPGGTARHIDQVWVRRGAFDVVKYQVTANRRTSRASDHNPLTAILQRR